MNHLINFLIGVGIGIVLFEICGRWLASKKAKKAIHDTYNMSRSERMKNGGPY